MEFREIYCTSCKKIIGRYNIKFFSEDKIAELMKTSHVTHVRNGHEITIRKFVKDQYDLIFSIASERLEILDKL